MANADHVLNLCQRRIARALLGLVVATMMAGSLPLAWQARRLSSGWIEAAERAWSFYGRIREGRMMAMPGQNPWQTTAVRLTVGFAFARCMGRAHFPMKPSGRRAAAAEGRGISSVELFCRGILSPAAMQGDWATTATRQRTRRKASADQALSPRVAANPGGPPEWSLILGPPLVVI